MLLNRTLYKSWSESKEKQKSEHKLHIVLKKKAPKKSTTFPK